METDQWLSNYFTRLHDQYKIVNLKAGDEITTPFTNSIGDNIRIYATLDHDNHVIMSDDGNTINDLDMMGIDVTNPTRQTLIQDTLAQYGITLSESGEMRVTGSIQNIAVMKQNLLQAILRVGDLIQTRKGIVSNIFNQEVTQFFFDQDIGALPQYNRWYR